MTQLLEEFGAEAYGVYWLLCEEIAGTMEKDSPSTHLIHSDVKWSQMSYCSARVFRSIANRMQEIGLINVESIQNRLKIDIRKLLKYRDEYSKKSGESPDSRTEREQHRVEQRESSENAAGVTESQPPKTGPELVKETPIQAETRTVANLIWDRHPQARRSKLSIVEKRLREAVKHLGPVELKIGRMREIDARHVRWCASEQWAGKGMVNNLGNWFTEGICDNEPGSGELIQAPKHFDGRRPMFP